MILPARVAGMELEVSRIIFVVDLHHYLLLFRGRPEDKKGTSNREGKGTSDCKRKRKG